MVEKNPRVRGRFAPTPSGRMHLGNVFSALVAWLSARAAGGSIVLRIEDLDPRAQRPGVAQTLIGDLEWLGMTWDEGPHWQSERAEVYREAISRLLAAPESRQLLELLRRQGGDLQQAAQAALKGDGRELSALMDRVTATGEGARAAERLRERMERR